MADTAIVVLAGGEARRLPHKLERRIGEEPLLLRVYSRLRGRWPLYLAARGSFAPELDAQLDAPLLVDRWPARGPLGGLLSACGNIREAGVFAVAADLPHIDLDVLATLLAARSPDDEAIVPECDGRLQPLAAWYDRAAVLREGFALLAAGERSMHALLHRLTTRRIPFAPQAFVNLNTAQDFESALA